MIIIMTIMTCMWLQYRLGFDQIGRFDRCCTWSLNRTFCFNTDTYIWHWKIWSTFIQIFSLQCWCMYPTSTINTINSSININNNIYKLFHLLIVWSLAKLSYWVFRWPCSQDRKFRLMLQRNISKCLGFKVVFASKTTLDSYQPGLSLECVECWLWSHVQQPATWFNAVLWRVFMDSRSTIRLELW